MTSTVWQISTTLLHFHYKFFLYRNLSICLAVSDTLIKTRNPMLGINLNCKKVLHSLFCTRQASTSFYFISCNSDTTWWLPRRLDRNMWWIVNMHDSQSCVGRKVIRHYLNQIKHANKNNRWSSLRDKPFRQREGSGTAIFILNLAARWCGWSTPHPGSFSSREIPRWKPHRTLWMVPGPVWTGEK